jgi:hypothetical protein
VTKRSTGVDRSGAITALTPHSEPEIRKYLAVVDGGAWALLGAASPIDLSCGEGCMDRASSPAARTAARESARVQGRAGGRQAASVRGLHAAHVEALAFHAGSAHGVHERSRRAHRGRSNSARRRNNAPARHGRRPMRDCTTPFPTSCRTTGTSGASRVLGPRGRPSQLIPGLSGSAAWFWRSRGTLTIAVVAVSLAPNWGARVQRRLGRCARTYTCP